MLYLCLRMRHATGTLGLIALFLACSLDAFAQPPTSSSAPQVIAAESPSTQASAPMASQTPATTIVAPELAQGVDPPERPRTSRRTNHLPPANDPSEPEMQWYGWQTLVADAASVAAIAAGVGFDNGFVGLSGFGGFLFGAPVVHWYHGALGRGFASFGMRFAAGALFVVGGAACVATALSGNNNGTCGVMIVGALLIPASMVIDAAVLSWEETPSDVAGTRLISPWFSAERRAAGVVWQGTF